MLEAAEEIIKQCGGAAGISVSGGSDSMCLLDFILRCGGLNKEDMLVINFDHGIRGGESARDSRFVADYCAARGLELHFVKTDIPSAAKKSGRSLETEARLFRKAEYEKLIQSGRVKNIMLAHNLNDHTESVLMHIFRGSGLKGLIGPGAFDGYIVRPLINTAKSEILEYIKRHEVPYVTDSTNESSDYSRNYLRNEILPLIRARWQNVDGAISGLSEITRGAYADLSGANRITADGDSVLIGLESLSPYTITEGLAQIGIPSDITRKHIDAVLALNNKPCGAAAEVPHGGRAVREYDAVRLFVSGGEPIGAPKVDIIDCEVRIETDKLRFDTAKLPSGCIVRTRRDGDMFTPCGGRRKLLSDYLTDKKIPKYKRDRLALIASGSEIYAIAGVEISDKIKLDGSTKAAAEIRIKDTEEG